jgi:hypothetical protein
METLFKETDFWGKNIIKIPQYKALKASNISIWEVFDIGAFDVSLILLYKDDTRKEINGYFNILKEFEIINNNYINAEKN